jgi:type I restriction enzyme R subunit
LAEIQHLPQRNLAVELLEKLLQGEVKVRRKKNVVQSRSFAEMLAKAIHAYHNRAITTQQVIDHLIQLARDMREAEHRGDQLGLNDEEIAFYDALAANGSAVEVMGNEQLAIIARELVDTVKRNVTIDWTIKETVRAKLRVMVRRILKKFGYPPDLQEQATQTVLEQAEVLCAEWAM